MQIKKSQIESLIEKGIKAKEIAEQLGIPTTKLTEACKHFQINLRAKPRNNFEFIDDTITNTSSPFDEEEQDLVIPIKPIENKVEESPKAVDFEDIEL